MIIDKLKTTRLPVAAILLCICTVLIVWSALFYDDKRSTQSALEQARRDVANLALAYREHISRTVGAIDQLMLAIASEHANKPDEYVIPGWVEKSALLQGLAVQVSLIGS